MGGKKRVNLRVTVAVASAVLLNGTLAGLLQAQLLERFTNPVVNVAIDHPPDMGIQTDRIVFGPATGECSDDIISAAISRFVSNDIEVIDRANLDLLLAEQNFAWGGRVDSATATQLGRILGPSVMLVIRVQRCATEQKRTYDNRKSGDRAYTVYFSTTRAYVKASVQTIDLTTGRIFGARNMDHSPERRNRSTEGYPEYPSEYDVLDMAFGLVVGDLHRMFLPWTERTELVYYNDKKCDLKSAYQALKVGMQDRAYELSMGNLERCKQDPKVKPKTLAHAWYNVGMSHVIRGEHEAAIEAFQQAAMLRPGTIVSEALADAQRSMELADSIQVLEEQTAIAMQERELQETQAQEIRMSAVLTNDDVVAMVEQGLPPAIILKKIETSECDFDVSAEALSALVSAGVGEDVVMAMMVVR